MTNNRAKRGGQIGKNGEFYKGGTFLPSTGLPKQSPTQYSKKTYAPKPLTEWQLANLLNAIEGTKATIEQCKAEGNERGLEANEIQLANYLRKLQANSLP